MLLALLPRFRRPDLSFLRFLLIVSGIGMAIFATTNQHRRAQLIDLREEALRGEQGARRLRLAIAEDRRVYDALAQDPRVREALLEDLLGPDEERHGIPLDRWLAGERFDPES
ncbi:MAG: hypothetical protein ACO4BJ_13140 [Planctomycetota bacterium]